MEKISPDIFRAYDIRGIYPQDLDEKIAYKIAQAYAKIFSPKEVVIGKDIRLSSDELAEGLISGFTDAGVNIIDIGTVTTDMLYFAVANYDYPGGVVVTGSHNPKEYNGMKMVREKAIPICAGEKMEEIRDVAVSGHGFRAEKRGEITQKDIFDDYIDHVLSFINRDKIKKFKIVVNANCGAGGKSIEKLTEILGQKIVPLNLEPDPSFPVPEGRPDPLVPANTKMTSKLILESGADLGISWDSDADRCFFLDEKGELMPPYYTTAILAKYLLAQKPGGKIIHDPRLTWAIIDAVKEAGGISLLEKAGHSFIKWRMRKEDGLFAAETSAHYYFHDNFYCDNGMIPFLSMLEILSRSGGKMSDLYKDLKANYPISGELNYTVKNQEKLLSEFKNKYRDAQQNDIDGISIEYPDWRANLRSSNTEPLVRLNVEARKKEIVDEKVGEIEELIGRYKNS